MVNPLRRVATSAAKAEADRSARMAATWDRRDTGVELTRGKLRVQDDGWKLPKQSALSSQHSANLGPVVAKGALRLGFPRLEKTPGSPPSLRGTARIKGKIENKNALFQN